ncbi:MAG: hypothetical protein U0842_12545 [Candidatus Binatia bacterium]
MQDLLQAASRPDQRQQSQHAQVRRGERLGVVAQLGTVLDELPHARRLEAGQAVDGLRVERLDGVERIRPASERTFIGCRWPSGRDSTS